MQESNFQTNIELLGGGRVHACKLNVSELLEKKTIFSGKRWLYPTHYGRAETITVVLSETRTRGVIISRYDDTNVV